MSDTETARPPEQPHSDHEHRRHRWMRAVLIGWIPHLKRSATMLILSWLAPFIIMGVGYGFFPSLSAYVSLANVNEGVWAGMFTQLTLTVVWVIYEIWYTTHRNTSVTQLQADAWGDFATTFGIVFVLGMLVNQGSVPFWYIVPMIGAFIDAGQATLLAINNASQKPGVGAKTGT